ncbi:MAG: MATE family efflux transporter [Verrucomicrobiales bacterium]
MSQSSFLRRVLLEGRASLMLAVPLIAGQVSQMLVGLADTVMIGRLGVVPLAAATFANTVLHLPLMFGIGITMAVSIRVSQARGANQPSEARGALRHGLLLGLLVGLLSVGLAYGLIPFLGVFGQEPAVTHAAGDYFVIVAFSMIPAIGSMAVKNHADAMNHPWPAFWILLGGVVLNILMNWVLIWGHWGTPALGLEGRDWPRCLRGRPPWGADLVDPAIFPSQRLGAPEMVATSRLVGGAFAGESGTPASLQLLAEIGAFVAATILIGTMSKEALASHQVAISCAATVFMFPSVSRWR